MEEVFPLSELIQGHSLAIQAQILKYVFEKTNVSVYKSSGFALADKCARKSFETFLDDTQNKC